MTKINKHTKRVAIMGASGFIGSHLTSYLLENTDYHLLLLSSDAESLDIPKQYLDRVELRSISVFDVKDLKAVLPGIEIVYYLIHMMAYKGRGSIYKLEAQAAGSFSEAAKQCDVKRVIFLGGLGNDNDKLSQHLASRHNSGRILAQHMPNVIEFRASMVIGDGSVGYDIIRCLVRNLPVQTMPTWAKTKTQPIALHNAMQYLSAATTVQSTGHDIVEIGGPDQVSYREMVEIYAKYKGKNPKIFIVPIVPLWLAGWWLNIFTPKRHAKVGRQMAESLASPMVVTNNRAQELFPDIRPDPIQTALNE